MIPNVEQTKALVRWFLAWASGIVMGYLTTRNWLNAEQLAQVASFFSSETVVTLIVAVGTAAWGMLAHAQKNAVAIVAKMPEVAKVEVHATPAGLALRQAAGSKPDALVLVEPRGA